MSECAWKKISRLMPSGRRFALDRASTLDEIRLMLGCSISKLHKVRTQAL
ncbi:MAG: hypothetical protein ACLQEQ_04335 [Nitrososphaerales archaeon]